jgi:hypothetical protein
MKEGKEKLVKSIKLISNSSKFDQFVDSIIRMLNLGIEAAPKVATVSDRLQYIANVIEKRGEGWSKLPHGWTRESLKEFWGSLTGDAKHKVTKCIKLMDSKVTDPGAFCASCKRILEKK